VPSDWGMERFKSLLAESAMKGYPDEPLLAATQSHGVIRKSDYGNRTVTASKDLHLLKLVEIGDFVISLRSFQGGIERCHHRGIISPAYTVLRARSDAYRDYLTHLFKSKPFVGSLTLCVTGIREGQNIDYSKLSVELLPVPPDDEQTLIVNYLAHANARIEKAIRSKLRMIALLDEQLVAVTAELMNVGGVKRVRAKDVCLRIVDCKNRTPEFVEDGTFHVIRTTCVRSGEFSMEGSYPTDEVNYREWIQRGAPRVGDVLFTREAPAGEAALVPDRADLCLGQRMMYLRPDPDQVLPDYLLLAIYAEPARRFINVATNGSTVGHLRIGDVGSLPLDLPPLAGQREIVEKHSRGVESTRRTNDRIAREIELLREFRASLISGVVTGQVDVRTIAASLPNIEPIFHGDTSGVEQDVDPAEFVDEVTEASED
jgi:type I restriction enzyme S subunit